MEHIVDPVNSNEKRRSRGRPKKDKEIEDFGSFMRGLLLLNHFHEARPLMKLEAALERAARKGLSCVAEMKRVRARYQPAQSREGVITYGISGLSPEDVQKHKDMGLPEVFWNNPRVFPVGIGPVPTYPRFNASQENSHKKSDR